MENRSEKYYYVPNISNELSFLDTEIPDSSENDIPNGHCWIYNKIQHGGIFNHSNYNENIKKLPTKLKICDSSEDSLLAILKQKAGYLDENLSLENLRRQHSSNEKEQSSNINVSVVYVVYDQKILPAAIARKYGIDLLDLKLMISKYKRKLSKIKRDNRLWLNKRTKMNEEILETIKSFLDSHQYSNFTLDDLRIFLTKKLGQVDALSNSTIGRCIKSKFNMSFKKINKVNPKVFDSESKRKMLEEAALQIKLISKGCEVIYIDEFKYSSRRSDLYGWTLKERSGYRKKISSEFQASFIVAFSMKRIIGVCATTKTYNATKFKYFLKQLSNFVEDDFALICNNAKNSCCQPCSAISRRKEAMTYHNSSLLSIYKRMRETNTNRQE